MRERKTGRALAFRTTSGWEPPVAVESSTCKKEEKKPFEEFSPCSDFRMGSEGGGLVGSRGGRHVGDSSDCSLCSFPLFRLMDGASWDRKPSSTPTGRCLNLWLLIKADYVHFQQFFFSKHTFLTRQNKELFFFFFPRSCIICVPSITVGVVARGTEVAAKYFIMLLQLTVPQDRD